jgi:hypothetical protein
MNPILIYNVSRQPYISIARHYGGIKIQNVEYIYQPVKDVLIRKDWVKKTKGISWDKFVELVKKSEE